jgi:GDP-D-mannose 3', 5'-epimerase
MPCQKECVKNEGIFRSQLESRIVNFHNVFGPLGTWQGGQEKAPAALCRKIATTQLEGLNDIEIWGDGEQTRSFCYIDDCVTVGTS